MFKNGIHICFNFFSLYLKINTDKTTESYEISKTCLGSSQKQEKLSILNDVKKDTSNVSHETTSATNTVITPTTSTSNPATSDTYIYGVGILAVLAIGICIFFAYNTSQAANKKQVNEKQD